MVKILELLEMRNWIDKSNPNLAEELRDIMLNECAWAYECWILIKEEDNQSLIWIFLFSELIWDLPILIFKIHVEVYTLHMMELT